MNQHQGHDRPKLVSIVGLTASGKSAIGIKLAQQFNGEIISADSRQVYRGLDIGTAKVTPEERALVPHHLLDVVDPQTHPVTAAPCHPSTLEGNTNAKFDVFKFQELAYKAIDDIISRGKLPILVGGTGLYSRSVVEGYTFGNKSNATQFPSKVEGWQPNGLTGCVKDVAPEQRSLDVLQICLLPPREFIRPLVEQRVESRLANGMIEETKALLAAGVSKQWLSSLGLEYYWNIELLDGKITLEEYKYWLATKTMQFAKRQRTWYRREKNTVFLTNPETFLADCQRLVSPFLKSN